MYWPSTVAIMLKVCANYEFSVCDLCNPIIFPFPARKLLESQVPIVRTDGDIELLVNRRDKSVQNILDMFLKANVPLHVLRAIEPNLRFGAAVRELIAKTKEAPICPYWNTDGADQCVHIFSRKQIGDVLIKFLVDKR